MGTRELGRHHLITLTRLLHRGNFVKDVPTFRAVHASSQNARLPTPPSNLDLPLQLLLDAHALLEAPPYRRLASF